MTWFPTIENSELESDVAKKSKLAKLGKDPTVSTDFLPDRDREEQEEQLRNQLKKVWGMEKVWGLRLWFHVDWMKSDGWSGV